MKQTINSYEFQNAFKQARPDNFSYDGLEALFEYLEQYETDTGEEIELDVIALCCDYSELSIDEVISQYTINDEIDLDDLDDDEKIECVTEWLNDRTSVIKVDDDTVIIQDF